MGRANDIPDITVIMVSYNSRAITLRAIETLLANAGDVSFELIVWDNASEDGSAEAIEQNFPDVHLIKSKENIGFGAANNRVAYQCRSEWILLLNPDTETHPKAVEILHSFGKSHPEAGIVGGRTVFPDGTLNPASCWNKMTLWSLICGAFGLRRMFPETTIFNPEGIGGWKRDSVRQVDIVVGCFMLLRTSLWHDLNGFCEKYFMYGEEADLCLRAAKLGYRPMITPEAQIMHLVGASTPQLKGKILKLMKAKATLIRDHWSKFFVPIGISFLWIWTLNHRILSVLSARFSKSKKGNVAWDALWETRHDWLRGY